MPLERGMGRLGRWVGEGVAEGGDVLDRRAALEAGADAGWRGVGCLELWAGGMVWVSGGGLSGEVGVSLGCFGQEASI